MPINYQEAISKPNKKGTPFIEITYVKWDINLEENNELPAELKTNRKQEPPVPHDHLRQLVLLVGSNHQEYTKNNKV